MAASAQLKLSKAFDAEAVDAGEVIGAEFGRSEDYSVFAWLKVGCDFPSVLINQFPLEFNPCLFWVLMP